MIIFALLSVAAIFLLLAAHPFFTYPLSLRVLRFVGFRARTPIIATASGEPQYPRFALCTCAYNEENVIRAKVENMIALAATVPNTDVLVYVDGSSDETGNILTAFSRQITVIQSSERQGKTHGMNELVARTTASVLVFSDANVRLDLAVLKRLSEYFLNPNVGCVCGNLIYTNDSESTTAQVGSLYWRGEQAIKRLESTWGRVMGADGSLFAVRAKSYRKPPSNLIDDFYVSLKVLLSGDDVIQVDDVIAYERSATRSAEELLRKARIACQAFNVHRALWPEISRMPASTIYMYISHKLLRWLSVFFLVMSGTLAFMALCIAGHARGASIAVCVAGGAIAAGWRWQIRPLSQIADMLLALAGTGYGVIQSFRGTSYRTWEPAASIRE
jgi:cellulose synthase/poly-beta-1,6-N-acetylglucosamine synthase-like glycosyltransferase